MKKVLMTLIVSLAFCGSILAQETHWPGFDYHAFMMNRELVARVQINGVDITPNDDFENVEVCPFVGEEQRGYDGFMVYYDGDPYAVVDMGIFYTDAGEPLTFKMFYHTGDGNGTLYEVCQTSEPLVTGTEYDDWDDPVILNFVTEQEGLTLDILGVGETNWNDQNYRGGYYLIASPVTEDVTPQEGNGFITSDYDLYSFDQAQELEWINRKSDGVIEHGKGYLYASLEDTQLQFEGTTLDEDVHVISLVRTEDNPEEGMRGWNLVGNPFAETAYIQESVSYYIINPDGRADLIVGEEIAPMNAVFVQATADGQTLTFTTQDRGKSPRLSLNVSNGRAVVDRAAVNFKQGQALPKFQLNPNHTKVYIPMDGKDYAVVSSEGVGEMPVNFKAESNGIYTLSYTNEEVSFGYLHLIDNMTGADTDLLETPSYTFNAKTTDYASRFKLVYATGSAEDESFAFFSNGNWIINNEGAATLQVVDVTGRILTSESINGCASVNVNAASGVYMLRLINGDNVKIQKVVVK